MGEAEKWIDRVRRYQKLNREIAEAGMALSKSNDSLAETFIDLIKHGEIDKPGIKRMFTSWKGMREGGT